MTGKWNVSAVLLDMDGTLLDTEKVYFNSLVAALNTNGYADDTVALCHAMVGLPGPACEAMLLDRYGENFPLAEINRAFLANRDKFMEAGLPLKPGTLELLDGLAAADCPMAIVTSSSRRSAERNLSLAGIRSRFDTILTLDDVTRGKPSPDLYLLAATRLGLAPQVCIAVEDFKSRRDRLPRRRRDHDHGAGHGAADRRDARKMRGRAAGPWRGAADVAGAVVVTPRAGE